MHAIANPIVVFDIGNVLLRWDPRFLYRKVFADEARMEWFLDEVCHSDWNLEQDRGRGWGEAIAEAVARHPGEAEAIRAYHERWPETVSGAIQANVEVLERLHALGTPLYAITNFSADKFALAQTLYPFLTLFRGVVVSGTERLLKPDPAIYALFLSRYGLDPALCIFIDDSAANIEGARAAGMRTIHYRDGVDVAEELRALGVPFDAPSAT